MDERDTGDSLRDLGKRVDKARGGRARPAAGTPPEGGVSDARAALSVGLRIGLELVVAVAVGVGHRLGIRPVARHASLGDAPVPVFLGIGAGMLNVYRAVSGMGMAMGYKNANRPPAASRSSRTWDEED